jgi:hypothetical protein
MGEGSCVKPPTPTKERGAWTSGGFLNSKKPPRNSFPLEHTARGDLEIYGQLKFQSS